MSTTPLSLAEAVALNDRIVSLVALRDTIARAIDMCESGRDLAALSRQMTDVLAQIDALTPVQAKVGDPIDEIAARRSARGAGATSSASGAGKAAR